MQKKGKDSGKPWLNSTTLFLFALFLGSGLYWVINREPNPLPLKYGELSQMLKAKDPAVRFLGIRAGRSAVSGEIQTTDPVSDGAAQPTRLVQKVPFRASRNGVEP